MKRHILKKLLQLYTVLFVVLATLMAISVMKEYSLQVADTIKKQGTEIFYASQTSYIYDKKGTVIAKLKGEKEIEYLHYQEIPNYVKQAFIAVEDRNFWRHPGIDGKGLVRVGLQCIKTGGKEVHGASTITQQLVRNIFLSSEVTIERKLKEMIFSVQLEKIYKKEQILEFYINNIYFGNGYYGIEAAAKGYFGHSVRELSLSEISFLCAIPNNPTYYQPYQYPDHTVERRNKILYDLYATKQISYAEYQEAYLSKVKLRKRKKEKQYNYEVSYAIDCAVRTLMRNAGFSFQYSFCDKKDYESYQTKYKKEYKKQKNNLYGGGYQIYTSLDLSLQAKIQSVLDQELSFDQSKDGEGTYQLQGAVSCIDNTTGKVTAVIGGRSQKYSTYTYNRAFQAYRQPGSAIKPVLVYAPALEKGYTKESRLSDRKSTDGPQNSDGTYQGEISLDNALIKSKNTAAWKLYQKIKPAYALEYLKKMKFTKISASDQGLAASLGGFTYGTTTMEMAGAYATFFHGGYFISPDCLLSIKDEEGKELYQSKKEKVFSFQTVETMLELLNRVISQGTAKYMNWNRDIKAYGKTGTTNENKDGWFCGGTASYTLTVWVGCDRPKPYPKLTGSSYPAKIWKKAIEICLKE